MVLIKLKEEEITNIKRGYYRNEIGWSKEDTIPDEDFKEFNFFEYEFALYKNLINIEDIFVEEFEEIVKEFFTSSVEGEDKITTTSENRYYTRKINYDIRINFFIMVNLKKNEFELKLETQFDVDKDWLGRRYSWREWF